MEKKNKGTFIGSGNFHTLMSVVLYSVIWTVLAFVGQQCELLDINYYLGTYLNLLPFLISFFSVLAMIGVSEKRCALYLIIFPIFFGASYVGLQYATYGIQSLSPDCDFTAANWIHPWTAVPAAFWSLIFLFIGWNITLRIKESKDKE